MGNPLSVRLYVWRGLHAWLAQCPELEIGGSGRTRDEATRKVRKQADYDARMIFGAGIEVVEGPPPPMEDA
jgi:hypothetical protein